VARNVGTARVDVNDHRPPVQRSRWAYTVGRHSPESSAGRSSCGWPSWRTWSTPSCCWRQATSAIQPRWSSHSCWARCQPGQWPSSIGWPRANSPRSPLVTRWSSRSAGTSAGSTAAPAPLSGRAPLRGGVAAQLMGRAQGSVVRPSQGSEHRRAPRRRSSAAGWPTC